MTFSSKNNKNIQKDSNRMPTANCIISLFEIFFEPAWDNWKKLLKVMFFNVSHPSVVEFLYWLPYFSIFFDIPLVIKPRNNKLI